MLVLFDSKTGNVKRFVQKLGLPSVQVRPGLLAHEPFVLVTHTTGFGQVPKSTLDFLDQNHFFLQGVASSGNRNWGDNFARAADILSDKYNVPILLKFELSGTKRDLEVFKERMEQLCGTLSLTMS